MLESANREIRISLREDARRRVEQARSGALVRAIDGLLFDLEDLNLRGVDRVPAVLRERSFRLLEHVPAAESDDLRVRHRVMPMMDVLFRAQELIFRHIDPEREADDDEELAGA